MGKKEGERRESTYLYTYSGPLATGGLPLPCRIVRNRQGDCPLTAQPPLDQGPAQGLDHCWTHCLAKHVSHFTHS